VRDREARERKKKEKMHNSGFKGSEFGEEA
jgi:hypothetical protein